MPYKDRNDKRNANRRYYEAHRRPAREREARETSTRKSLLQTRLPAQLVGRLVRLKDEGIATGAYPWRTVSAVVEALLLRGFESLAGDPFIDEMLQYLRVTSQIEGIAAHRKEAQAAVSRVKVELGELLKIKATEQAAAYFHAIVHDFEQMDANIWRDWALTEFKRSYPYLLKHHPKRVPFVLRVRRPTKGTP